MNEGKKKFAVYWLDMWADEEGGWEENERHYLGELEVKPAIGCEIEDIDILAAMRNFTYADLCGQRFKAIQTTDRRTIYAEDLYGSGEWWEVGSVKDHKPVYGLKLLDAA